MIMIGLKACMGILSDVLNHKRDIPDKIMGNGKHKRVARSSPFYAFAYNMTRQCLRPRGSGYGTRVESHALFKMAELSCQCYFNSQHIFIFKCRQCRVAV